MLLFTGGMMPIVIMSQREYRRDLGDMLTETCKREVAELDAHNMEITLKNMQCEIQALKNQHELDVREINKYKSMLERSETIVKAADKRIAFLDEKLKEERMKRQDLSDTIIHDLYDREVNQDA